MLVLNVAEKPSVAKTISSLLSYTRVTKRTSCKYTPNTTFKYKNDTFVFTAVLGHLFNVDFPRIYNNWQTTDYKLLLDNQTPITKTINDVNKTIQNNLQNLSKKAKKLIIWTDCDREGENIASEISKVCLESNPAIEVKRAHFNVISKVEIENALCNLRSIDCFQVKAVDARIELDLRLGSCFTRVLSNNLRLDSVVSYGPCQLPTLGFVVERVFDMENFVSEKFYSLELVVKKDRRCEANASKGVQSNTRAAISNKYDPEMNYLEDLRNRKTVNHLGSDPEFDLLEISKDDKIKNGHQRAEKMQNKKLTLLSTTFKHSRGLLYDKNLSIYFIDSLESSQLKITKILTNPTQKLKPLPLRTVELQKAMSSLFKLSSHKTMDIAEKLYNNGYISYPRTETDTFDRNFNHKSVYNELFKDNKFSFYRSIHKYEAPRAGKNNDNAHSPIYAIKSGNDLSGDDRKVYEYIARRYLGSVSENAKGHETTIEITAFISDTENGVSTEFKAPNDSSNKNKYVKTNRKGAVDHHKVDPYDIDSNLYTPKNTDFKESYNSIPTSSHQKSSKKGINNNKHVFKETFTATGLKITNRNYLTIFTYDKWKESEIIDVSSDYKLSINENSFFKIKESETTKPGYLTEPNLISLMDKNEIGTDATIAEHIKKITDRGYIKITNKNIIPTSLGYGLIKGFQAIDLKLMTKPFLRKELEKKLKSICKEEVQSQAVVSSELDLYSGFLDVLLRNINEVIENVRKASTKSFDNPRNERKTKNDSNDSSDSNDGELPQKPSRPTKNTKNQDTSNKTTKILNESSDTGYGKVLVRPSKPTKKSKNQDSSRKIVKDLSESNDSGYGKVFEKPTRSTKKVNNQNTIKKTTKALNDENMLPRLSKPTKKVNNQNTIKKTTKALNESSDLNDENMLPRLSKPTKKVNNQDYSRKIIKDLSESSDSGYGKTAEKTSKFTKNCKNQATSKSYSLTKKKITSKNTKIGLDIQRSVKYTDRLSENITHNTQRSDSENISDDFTSNNITTLSTKSKLITNQAKNDLSKRSGIQNNNYIQFKSITMLDKNESKKNQKRYSTEELSDKENYDLNDQSDNNNYCQCNLLVTKKICRTGNNSGKEFYSCQSWPNGCEYFRWLDETLNKVPYYKIQVTEVCNCGYETVVKLCRSKENKDRPYQTCCKAYKRCKFFKWLDE